MNHTSKTCYFIGSYVQAIRRIFFWRQQLENMLEMSKETKVLLSFLNTAKGRIVALEHSGNETSAYSDKRKNILASQQIHYFSGRVWLQGLTQRRNKPKLNLFSYLFD